MKRSRATGWVVVSAIAVACGGAWAAPSGELQQAMDVLRASTDEFRREEAVYRSALASAKISGSEKEDYAAYVAGLRVRMLEQCEVVRTLGGEEALEGFECVRLAPERTVAAVVPTRAVLTDEEKRAALGAKLDAIEGDIDEKLLKRQQEIRQTSVRASGGGAASSASGASSSAGASASAGSAQPGGSNAGSSTGSTGSAGEGMPGSAAGPQDGRHAARQTPSDGGVDDDVVARQLREAAEKETDPVLKEKLWAEYKKYREAKR